MMMGCTLAVAALDWLVTGGSGVLMPLMTVAALALVHAYRRFTGRPWSALGVRPARWALPQVALGTVVGMVALLAGNAVSVLLGVTQWRSGGAAPGVPMLALTMLLIAARASFPEELLFRGHLYEVVSARLGGHAALLVTTVSFGALHVFSQSPAEGVTERLLYVGQAMALGLLCGAARACTGTLWMAVGVHNAIYLAEMAGTEPVGFGTQLVIRTVALTLAAVAVLAVARAWRRTLAPKVPMPV